METTKTNILKPLTIGGLTLRNRIVMAPMTRSRGGTIGQANELMAKYYSQRATAGLIITEGTFVNEEAKGWLNVPGIYTEEHSNAWKPVVEAVHEKGGLIFLQLWHCGRSSHSSFHGGKLPVAPSAVKLNGDYVHSPAGKQPYETPRALEINEIKRTVEDYRRAAQFAKEAGFDGVEVHSANGYLLDEFLQTKTNLRQDQYGGSLENRYRLLKEVVHAVKSVWGADRVGVRLSPNGSYNDMGSPDYVETFSYVASQLDSEQLAYLHVLDGTAFGFHELGEPMTLADFRTIYKGVLMGNCGYDLDTAENRISCGDADLISFGRPFISNPDLVERFANGWPLNPLAEMSVWYSFDEKGYADFPTYEESKSAG